jgi:hypothetical protein
MPSPAASFRRMDSTVILVPLITGLPSMISGFVEIMGFAM